MAAYLRRSVHRSAFYGICYVLPQENYTICHFLHTECNFFAKYVIPSQYRCKRIAPRTKKKSYTFLLALLFQVESKRHPLRCTFRSLRYASFR